MTLFRMPILVWTILVTSVLVLLATPVITSALIMLFIDRNYGGSFFDPANGGDPILYQNVFWFYSHPAVYVMILPAMGMISEILPVFSCKPLFGYKAFVFATAAIGALGFSVWAHHMFTTGAVYLPFFSLMTFLIAVPTGVKMFNWIFTMWRGKLDLKTPMLFAIGFLTMFLIGGINGAFSASVPVDFAIHDTYWVVAHIHYVLFGGSVFAIMGGLYYWFPKMTGRMLNETLGKVQFVLMFIGFNLTFFPMHELGLAGMPRRIADYASTAGWNDLNLAATVGGFLIAVSMLPLLWNIFISLRSGTPAGDDPWEANTLEWATSSPPPAYNFDRLPGDPLRAPAVRCPPRAAGRSLGADDDDDRQPGADHDRAQPGRRARPRHQGRDQQPRPGDAAVHHLGGDVLRRSVRRLLQRTRERPRWPPINPETGEAFHLAILPLVGPGDDPADPVVVHLPVRRVGHPPGRPGRVPAEHRRHIRHRHRLPADAGAGLRPARRARGSPSRPGCSARRTSP